MAITGNVPRTIGIYTLQQCTVWTNVHSIPILQHPTRVAIQQGPSPGVAGYAGQLIMNSAILWIGVLLMASFGLLTPLGFMQLPSVALLLVAWLGQPTVAALLVVAHDSDYIGLMVGGSIMVGLLMPVFIGIMVHVARALKLERTDGAEPAATWVASVVGSESGPKPLQARLMAAVGYWEGSTRWKTFRASFSAFYDAGRGNSELTKEMLLAIELVFNIGLGVTEGLVGMQGTRESRCTSALFAYFFILLAYLGFLIAVRPYRHHALNALLSVITTLQCTACAVAAGESMSDAPLWAVRGSLLTRSWYILALVAVSVITLWWFILRFAVGDKYNRGASRRSVPKELSSASSSAQSHSLADLSPGRNGQDFTEALLRHAGRDTIANVVDRSGADLEEPFLLNMEDELPERPQDEGPGSGSELMDALDHLMSTEHDTSSTSHDTVNIPLHDSHTGSGSQQPSVHSKSTTPQPQAEQPKRRQRGTTLVVPDFVEGTMDCPLNPSPSASVSPAAQSPRSRRSTVLKPKRGFADSTPPPPALAQEDSLSMFFTHPPPPSMPRGPHGRGSTEPSADDDHELAIL